MLDAIEGPFPFPPPRNPEFSFIDLFAGIGGFRLPFRKLGVMIAGSKPSEKEMMVNLVMNILA